MAIVAAAAYFLYRPYNQLAQTALLPSQKQLQVTGDKCLDFGERAIAMDPAIVEFQMIVRLSKKAGVIERCMVDNGYKVNPVWLKYAEPLAKISAAKSQTSMEEELTNMRRADMQVFSPTKDHPDYWLKNN